MRSGTQLHKVTLPVEGNRIVLGQILDQFNLIRLFAVPHQLQRFLARKREILQCISLFDDLFHLLLDVVEILPGERRNIEVIVKTRVDGRSDRQFCFRIQVLHRLSQHMRTGVPIRFFAFLVVKGEDAQLDIPVDHRPEITDCTVYFGDAGHPGQPLADIPCDVDHRHRLCIFLSASVFQRNDHGLPPISSFPSAKQTPAGAPAPVPAPGSAALFFLRPEIKNPFRQPLLLSEGTHTFRIRGSTHLPGPCSGTRFRLLTRPGGQDWCRSEVVFSSSEAGMLSALHPSL